LACLRAPGRLRYQKNGRQEEFMNIETIDHIGIRVADLDRAMAFYELFGFTVVHKSGNDPVAVVKNADDVELNLVFNANDDNDGDNILMDIPTKYAGFTHVAFRVNSILETVGILNANNIEITQGPVKFGRGGHVSVFVRDPDRNTLEFRGREEDLSAIGGVETYENEN
jgi:lactoylglutathione lyase